MVPGSERKGWKEPNLYQFAKPAGSMRMEIPAAEKRGIVPSTR